MIHLSPAAINEIGRLKSKQPSDTLFRLRVKSGGCADLFYDLAFDTTVQSQDQVLALDDIRVVIDPESLNYITGLSLDYSEDLGIISSGSTTFLTGNSCRICQGVAISKSRTTLSPFGCLPRRIFFS